MGRRKPDSYAIATTVLRIIGKGNSVVLDNGVFGPVSLPETENAHDELVFAGVTRFAAGSKNELPAEKAFSRIAAGVRSSSRELSNDLKQARRQSRVFFVLMCVFLATGLCLILVALGLLLFDRVQAGVIGTVASTVSQAMTVLLFKKDRELRRHIDSYNAHVVSHHRILAMVDVAETIADPEVRDKAKHSIISSLLQGMTSEDKDPPRTRDS